MDSDHIDIIFYYLLRTITTVTMMIATIIWILYYFYPQTRVSGFKQLIQHYILRTPEKMDDIDVWLRDEQFNSTFGTMYEEIQKQQNSNKTTTTSISTIHFCFLVHGVNGYAQDLSYPNTVLKLLSDYKQIVENSSTEKTTTKMIVHCARCNEKKTKDGIINGGTRLFHEMMDVIQNETENVETAKMFHSNASEKTKITISILGNSLGGLYSRYAIAELYEAIENSAGDYTSFFNQYRSNIEWNVFVSTATPHLGLSKNTYWPLPRLGEVGLAHSMGETGKDLFQLNNLLQRMALDSKFLKPMRAFKKRIAYANAYRTDFPVPTATAAFLHERSKYPHYTSEEERGNNNRNATVSSSSSKTKKDLVIATLYTRPIISNNNDDDDAAIMSTTYEDKKDDNNNNKSDDDNDSKSSSSNNNNNDDILLRMSNSLDSLGWKKVFVDLRDEMPIGVELPSSPKAVVEGTKKAVEGTKKAVVEGIPDGIRKRLNRMNSHQQSVTPNNNSTNGTNNNNNNISTPTKTTTTPFKKKKNDSCSLSQKLMSLKNNNDNDNDNSSITSRDIAIITNENDSNRIIYPLGHNMLVAVSRCEKSASFNSAGRPLIHDLSYDVIETIFS